MSSRFFRLTATAGATALLAVAGTVAATSASAGTAAPATAVAVHAVPQAWHQNCPPFPGLIHIGIPGLICINL